MRRWVIRMALDEANDSPNYVNPEFLDGLEKAGLGKVHDNGRNGETFDLFPPFAMEGSDSKAWSDKNAEVLRDSGFNAVAAPRWEE